MFEKFLAKFRLTNGRIGDEVLGEGGSIRPRLFDRMAGCVFENGLYRIHTPDSAAVADGLVEEAFPELRSQMSCFGFDWLGRQFALDGGRGAPSDPEILMLEPGTGEALEIPVPFSKFHDVELVEYANEALATDFYAEWASISSEHIEFAQCVGYRTPLFLGGSDTVDNLELTDIEVYWSFMGQLRVQVMPLPKGTRITGIETDN